MISADGILPLELDDVGYAVRGEHLLAGVSARIVAGSRLVILGPNGAGKSLLLRIAHAAGVRWEGHFALAGRRWASLRGGNREGLRLGVAACSVYGDWRFQDWFLSSRKRIFLSGS